MGKLSHIDEDNRPTMVDVSEKRATDRTALARSRVRLPDEIAAHISGDEIKTKKGPVFATAIIAGVMAAKKTHELIPFCHPLGLEKCRIEVDCSDAGEVHISCTISVHGRTGVEMEALTGASVGLLTIYDMVKGIERSAEMGPVRLIEKSGGASGDWSR